MKKLLFTLTLALVALAGCEKETPELEPIAVTSVSLDKTEVALIVGESANVKAIVKPDDAANKEVKWTVANTSIATVDEGEVTAVAVGETTLKVTTVDGGHTATIPVKVTAKAVKVSQIKLVGMPTTDFKEGRSVTISAVITPDDATDKSVTFTSSNPEVATVEYTESENNYSLALLKAVGPGKATITATANDGSGVKAEAEVEVTETIAAANCYIVTKAGTYSFKTVKGNSSKSVGSVASAEVLWESFGTDVAPAVGDLVKSVSYSNGKITYTATGKKGNAVIAAKDASGKILWSWHIWLTDQPQEQVYSHNAGTMMDRNLGAISTTPGDAGIFGLIYQWGRKDPFLGAYTTANTPAKSTITWPSPVSSDSSNGTIEYATANPTTFIINNSNNEDWYYTGSSDVDLTRWTESSSSKSIYDPCPAGWRVPDGGNQGIWSKARGSSSDFENSSFDWYKAYMDFSGIFGSESTILYPAAGIYNQYDGTLTNVRKTGQYWSASNAKNSSRAKSLAFDYKGAVSPSDNTTRVTGCSVRCVKE